MKALNITVHIIGKMLLALSIAFLIWMFVSWAEIVAHNTEQHPHYSDCNFFIVLTENIPSKKN